MRFLRRGSANWKRKIKQLPAATIIMLIIGLVVGGVSAYGMGFYDGVKWSVNFAITYLDLNVDAETITAGLIIYGKHIDPSMVGANITE